jgi:hypothetical protein
VRCLLASSNATGSARFINNLSGGIMQTTTLAYRGFQLLVTPVMDHEGLWEYRYCILRAGQKADGKDVVLRRRTLNFHRTAEAACMAGIELAKVEVDNLCALEKAV